MITAQSIILRAHIALQDEDGTRWPATELVRHLNDGQREIVRLRPDQKTVTETVTLASGYRHVLADTVAALIDMPNNMTGRHRRITKVDMLQLDAVLPDWRSRTPSAEVTHFMHDLREPRVFHTFPPTNNAQVSMVHSVYPIDVPAPGGPPASSVTGNIDLSDTWADALLNWVLFKSYSKDAEFGGNAQMAASYLAIFNAAIGSQLQSTATVAPQT
jgi:hypothetical protein